MKIPLSLPDIGNSEKKIALEILNSLWLTHGKYNVKFEKAFANYRKKYINYFKLNSRKVKEKK